MCIRDSTHPTRIGAFVTIEDRLVVLRGNKRERVLTIDEGEKTGLLTDHELLDDDFTAGVAEHAFDHHVVDRRVGFIFVAAQDHAFTGSQPVSLDDNGCAFDPDVFLRRIGFVEARVIGGSTVLVSPTNCSHRAKSTAPARWERLPAD